METSTISSKDCNIKFRVTSLNEIRKGREWQEKQISNRDSKEEGDQVRRMDWIEEWAV